MLAIATCNVIAAVMQIEEWLVAGFKDIPDMAACTSLLQQWHVPRGLKIMPEPVTKMVFANPWKLNRNRRAVIPTVDDIQ